MAKTPTMKATIQVEASTKKAEEQLTNVGKIADSLGKDGVTINVKTNDDISGLNNLKTKLEEINSTIREKQTLLSETQSKIDAQANAEVAAAKRVQSAYEKWQHKEDKRTAKTFAAEYDNYLSKDYDTSKLDFTTSNGRKQYADQVDIDYYDVLDEYKITDEELDKLKFSV